jgi:CHAT domain-containing protein
LTAERDVIGDDTRGRGIGLLAVGNPAFDDPPPAAVAQADIEPRGVESHVHRSSMAPCASATSFAPLPASEVEVGSIRELWLGAVPTERDDVRVLVGPAADEGTWKREAPKYRVLHLATHGFHLDRCDSWIDGRAPGAREPPRHPLLLSGVALAGAGRPPETADAEDGFLTAEEIASIDLRGVEWVVLSGCDTGLGYLADGQGVLGLRRAFQIAGARSTIMSLWRVQDDSARLWMSALYRARLGGRSTADAVRQASLERLEALREAGASTHPFFWAPFVAAGDWR